MFMLNCKHAYMAKWWNNGVLHQDEGFTIVEVVVTLVVTVMFLTAFFQTFLVMQSQRVNLSRQAKASDIAYSNLRKITTRPVGLSCDSSMDLIANASAPGKDLSGYFTPEPASVTSDLGTITQTMKAYAPAGCSAFDTTPLKIVSTVTYGTSGDSVVHATLVQ